MSCFFLLFILRSQCSTFCFPHVYSFLLFLVLRDYVGVQLPSLPGPLAIGSSTAAEKDASTVPTSATLMPPPTSGPSHISSGPIPLPPIDLPSSVSDPQKKQGKKSKKKSSKNDQERSSLEPEPSSSDSQDPVPCVVLYPSLFHFILKGIQLGGLRRKMNNVSVKKCHMVF